MKETKILIINDETFNQLKKKKIWIKAKKEYEYKKFLFIIRLKVTIYIDDDYGRLLNVYLDALKAGI